MKSRDQQSEIRNPKSEIQNPQSVVFALVGPSCTFKSKIAIDLGLKFPFEIISADSRLIYKGMDIGTSKPSLTERNLVCHYMIDIVEPDYNYSVALYKKEAEKELFGILSRNKFPLFAGGTGLYLNSVLLGLSIPEVKPDVSFRRQLKKYSQEELYKNLKKLDPKAAEVIHENDHFRTIRALEVIYKTNKMFSKLKTIKETPFTVLWIGLTYKDRELHLNKIQERTYSFCKNGFISEVSDLLEKYGELDLFKNTIGYSEAIDFLKGKLKLTEMADKITLRTRQLVKRQTTWFKSNKKIHWIYIDELSYNQVLDRVLELVSNLTTN